jgi:hypothetical protein
VINLSIEYRSLPRDRLSWQRLLKAFLYLFMKMIGHFTKVGHNRFIPVLPNSQSTLPLAVI